MEPSAGLSSPLDLRSSTPPANVIRVDAYDLLKVEMDEVVRMMCKALNDPKRLLILAILGEEPKTVTQLVHLIGSPQANISQHLAVLRDRGIVKAVKDGNSVIYSLRYPRLLEVVSILRGVLHDEVERRGSLVAPED